MPSVLMETGSSHQKKHVVTCIIFVNMLLSILINFGDNVVFVVVYHVTVKPANAVTAIMQPPILRHYFF